MTDKQILKSIKALARGECANYSYGNCLLTDERCHLVNPDYESIHDGAIDCDYFLECVLPADWNLNDLVSYALWYDAVKSVRILLYQRMLNRNTVKAAQRQRIGERQERACTSSDITREMAVKCLI